MDVIEYQILSCLRERFTYLKHAHNLRKELFESPQTRTVFDIISSHHQANKTANITIRSLRLLITSNVKPTELPKFRGIVRRIKTNSPDDISIVDDILTRFIKKQLLKHAILEAVNQLDAGEEADLELVQQRIGEAVRVSPVGIEDSYDYFHDPYKRIHDESREPRVATQISRELDAALGGGIAQGEIGIIIAPTSVGKTMALINVGYAALLQGKKIVHVTLEIKPTTVGRRYDVRATKIPFVDLKENHKVLKKKLDEIKELGGGLKIKDYRMSLCSVPDLRAYLERLRAKKYNFDFLIVDYADLMYCPKKYKERRYELSSIISSLRRLAAEFSVPVWTASQATRRAGEAGRTKLWDIAEDIGKANWCDIGLTISQTSEEKNEGIAWMELAKVRTDGGNPRVQLNYDIKTQVMKALRKEPRADEVKRKLRG